MAPFKHMEGYSVTFVNGADIGRCLQFAVLLPHNLQLFDNLWQALEPLYLDCYATFSLDVARNEFLVQLFVHAARLIAVETPITYYTAATDTAGNLEATTTDDRPEHPLIASLGR